MPEELDREQVLQGELEHVTYHSEETGYAVLKVFPDRGYGDPEALVRTRITAVGTAPTPAEGIRVRLRGSWQAHKTHGRQFAFESYEALPPADDRGLAKYLASSAFHGIGPKTAERIVAALGGTALQKIQEDPACLSGIRGLRRRRWPRTSRPPCASPARLPPRSTPS